MQRQTKTLTGKPVPNALSANRAEDCKQVGGKGGRGGGGQTFSESVLQSFFVFVFDTL